MLIYWIVFLAAVLLAITRLRISAVGWCAIAAPLILFIGLRYEVGWDWASYLAYLVRVTDKSLFEVLQFKDPGYQIVNWVSAAFGFDVWFVNTVAAAVFVVGLVQFIRTLPDPRVALAVSIPYIVIVMAMGYTRQAMAFGLVLWALKFLVEQRLVGFVALLALSATFHKSAVILVPLAVLANTRNRTWTFVWVGATGLLLFVLLLQEHVEALYQNYVVSDYADASEGGPVRVLMNAIPALFFLVLRKRFAISQQERALWFWISALALVCIPLVTVSATAVDRVALYLMPIQLVVASHLPTFVRGGGRVLVRASVLAFYGLVMFVWLNYAGHREAWIPYQFWLFV